MADVMIRARGRTGGGEDLVVLGLSHENVARLFADEPIVVRTAEPAPAGVALEGGPVIVILAGSDERAIVDKLTAAGLIGPHADVNDEWANPPRSR
jgi:hypothetical protein